MCGAFTLRKKKKKQKERIKKKLMTDDDTRAYWISYDVYNIKLYHLQLTIDVKFGACAL